jgi:hypothetical protein
MSAYGIAGRSRLLQVVHRRPTASDQHEGGEAARIHEGVDLETPTGNAWRQKEIPRGPILLQRDHRPVAFRKIRARGDRAEG